ncbi:hypothetical protein DV515_00016667 [Chloebia gouldiae]|uniref:Uncharacterized protein n=1 Tax=Chloebia gouldiae TaxID=44316 RepID=A0A3L8RRP1_CHLGU|nr:hypothetical protein DV515_00016667 [Chloebia gouldiae]
MVPAGKSCRSGTRIPGCPRNSRSLGASGGGYAKPQAQGLDTAAPEPCNEGWGVQLVWGGAVMSGFRRAFSSWIWGGRRGKGRILPQGEAESRKSGRKAERETGEQSAGPRGSSQGPPSPHSRLSPQPKFSAPPGPIPAPARQWPRPLLPRSRRSISSFFKNPKQMGFDSLPTALSHGIPAPRSHRPRAPEPPPGARGARGSPSGTAKLQRNRSLIWKDPLEGRISAPPEHR